jgi:colanic acid/amylovoran biosynthesis glycosyltransferase
MRVPSTHADHQSSMQPPLQLALISGHQSADAAARPGSALPPQAMMGAGRGAGEDAGQGRGRAPVVYLVNQYPAVSHTFIRREIAALEDLGVIIDRQAMRVQPGLVDPQDLAEQARTRYLLANPLAFPAAAAAAALRPGRGFAALAAAAGMMRRSDRPPHMHLIYLLEACELARRIRRSGARHIHAHFGTNPAEVAMLAAELAGVSFSFTVHGQDEFDKPEFVGLRRKIAAARFVASVSDHGSAQLMRWCRPEDRDKIHVVRCGLDLTREPMAAANASRRLNRFVCVGRFCVEKAQHVFIEALAALRREGLDVEGVLVGDGDLRLELENLAAARGLTPQDLHFSGWLSGDDVLREMRNARALVVSSFAENLPVVIIEALAARRPVVATWIAGIPEIVVPGETGWLVAPGSLEGLVAGMRACLEAPEHQLSAMGERGRALILARHDLHAEAQKLLALFPAD